MTDTGTAHPGHGATPPDTGDMAALVLALIGTRQSVAPKRLQAPGPSDTELQHMVEAAVCAPDHRGLKPWRLVRITAQQRDALADLFEACSREREPPPSAEDLAQSRAKAYRAPTLLLAVLKSTPPDPEVPVLERAVTLGAALMALLLAAHGLGFGAMLTSGRAVRTARFARAFQLADDEQAVCFISVGRAPALRGKPRGSAHERMTDWKVPSGPGGPARVDGAG